MSGVAREPVHKSRGQMPCGVKIAAVDSLLDLGKRLKDRRVFVDVAVTRWKHSVQHPSVFLGEMSAQVRGNSC